MASITLSMSDRLTAAEMIKRGEITGDQRMIIEAMSATNELLADAAYCRANKGTINSQIVRTALPRGQRRVYNQGVQTEASQTDLIHDVTEQIETYSKVDCALIDNQPNKNEALMQEDIAFIEGLGQTMADDIIYGNHLTDNSATNGFAARCSTLGKNCVSFKGNTSNKQTSLYLVKWGPQFTKLIYPNGASGVGISRNFKGQQTVTAPGGGEMEAYVTHYKMDFGVSVGHPLALIRLCNIDMNDALSKDEMDALVREVIALKRLLPQGDGAISLIGNADIMAAFDLATLDKANVVYPKEDPWGKEINVIRGMRCRQCDAILNTEAVVS